MKLGRKDYTISVKTGTDANKAKFKKECVQGEIYHATDTGFFYIAEVTASASDATLSKFGTPAFANLKSVSFDGSDDFLSIGNLSTLSSATSFSVSIWVNLSNWSGNVIYAVFTSGTGNSDRVCFYLNSLNEVRFGVNGSVGTCLFNLSTPVDYRNSGWHHLVGTYNGTNVTLFFDGTQVSTTTSSVPSTTSSTIGNNAIIAGETWSSSRYFPGLIDEVSVFNSVLSASNITAIYNSGVPNDLTSLSPVHWYRMGENDGGTGTTITDQGSGGKNGTLTNGPTFSSNVPT